MLKIPQYLISLFIFFLILLSFFFVIQDPIQAAFRHYKSSYFNSHRHKWQSSTPNVTPTPLPSPTLTPTPTPTPTPIPQSQDSKNWGAYVGWLTSDVTTFETKIGIPMNHLATFVHWGNENEFPEDLAALAKADNRALVLYWEAMDYNVTTPNDPRFSYDTIIQGKWDSYIKDFAQSVKSYGSQVILIPFEEMNGDWYPSSILVNGNTAQKHITAYRHIHDLFNGVTNVKFGWAVNCESVPDTKGNQITDFYPGDNYVDIVGVDGFNFGDPWQSYREIFGQAITTLETYEKPIMIFSMSSADGPQKAAWITDTITEINKNPAIVGWIWFNENKERDWRVWSDPASLTAFQNSLKLNTP